MSAESQSLRAKELRFLYCLLGECCEMGADPLAWRMHMLARLNTFFGARSSVCMDVTLDSQLHGIGTRINSTVTADKYSSTEQSVLSRCIKNLPIEGNPLGSSLFRLSREKGNCAMVRAEIVTNSAWERSQIVTDYFALIGWYDMMKAILPTPNGFQCMNFAREKGASNFSRRLGKLLHCFVTELGTISEVRLAKLGSNSILSLPPRERQVLLALSEGDDEKQVALRLGITRNTVHEYVRRLLQRYGVSSRSELLMKSARQIHANRVAQELSTVRATNALSLNGMD